MIEPDKEKSGVYERLLRWLAVEAETALLQVQLESDRRAKMEALDDQFRKRLQQIKEEEK